MPREAETLALLLDAQARIEAERRSARAAELQRKLQEAGYTVTPEEAELILKDALSRGNAEQLLGDLKRALDALNPPLQELSKKL